MNTSSSQRHMSRTGFFSRVIAMFVAAVFSFHVLAQAPATPNNDNPEDLQPKFVWGVLLINIATKMVTSLFMNWLTSKLTTDISPLSIGKLLFNSKSVSIVPLDSATNTAVSAKAAGAPENTVAGEPSDTVKVKDGRENYQGVHAALIAFDRDGNALGFRPVTSGFRTGERFKLRVLPTFDGLLVIDNINPKGERRQIYPPRGGDVAKIKTGVEILIPLAKDQYFEFVGATGEEQLVLTVRDPRAFGAAAATTKVYRRDESNGSNFVQEVSTDTYPLISQGMRLQHD